MIHQGVRTLAGQLATGVMTLRNPDGSTMAGYVSPNLQSLRLVHNATKREITDQEGDTVGLIFLNSHLECTFDFIQQGTSLANAKLAAQTPEAGGTAAVTGLPVLKKGPFVDALNTNGVSVQPWIYEGGENFTLPADDKATGSITLMRYPKILTGARIL